MEKSRSWSRLIPQGLALWVTYSLMGLLCAQMHTQTAMPPMLWAPSGVGLAALVLLGLDFWIVILFGAFFVSWYGHNSVLSSLVIAMGQTFQSWFGAKLLTRFTSTRPSLAKTQELFVFMILSMGLSTLIGSFWAVGGLYLNNAFSLDEFFSIWRTWWIGQALGALIIGCFLINFSNDGRFRMKMHLKLKFELIALFATIILVSALIFTPLAAYNHSLLVRPYLLFSLMIWASLRFDLFGATTVSMVIFTVVAIGSLMGFLAFPNYSHEERMVIHQYLVSILVLTGLILGAAVREKEEAVEARNEFLSIASHELKTPITSLKLKLQMTQKKLKNTPEINAAQVEQLEFLTKTQRQVDRLVQIVDQLLDVSKATRQSLKLSLEEFDLSVLIRDLIERMAVDLANANCTIETKLEEHLICHWDVTRIEQVLENILSNGIKYAKGSLIQISTQKIGDRVQIMIRDHGPGIEESHQPFIFDRFVRASESRHVSGLGLGLFISQQIAKAHGGSVEVKSIVGKGAAFIIKLPIRA